MKNKIWFLSVLFVLTSHVGAEPKEEFIRFRDEANLGPARSNVYKNLVRTAESSQKRVLKILKNRRITHRSFYVANTIWVRGLDSETRKEISNLPEVEGLGPNPVTSLRLPPQLPKFYFQASDIPDQIKLLGIDRVWNELKIKGAGIVVGSIDSGVMWDHEALKSRYRGTSATGVNHDYNWHDAVHGPFAPEFAGEQRCGYNVPAPCDDVDHGTHTVGTMVGEQVGRDRFGVAPDAKWIGCRGLDRGWGSVASYLECLEFMLAPYPQGGNSKTDGRSDLAPHVINISWVCEAPEGCTEGGELMDAVRALRAAGILVVVAAGNDGPNCGTVKFAPGQYSAEVLTVAAYDHHDGGIAEFSGRGPSPYDGGLVPAITAPGVFIRSSVPGGRYGDYAFKSGTSMAAPHLTGIVALIWSAKPTLIGKAKETIELIARSAQPMRASQTCGSFRGQDVPNAVYGYGIVNAFRAITE